MDGLEGGPRSGPDAEALLREATGWDIPVTRLADWVRAVGLDGAEVGYSADGLPAVVRQDWRLAPQRFQRRRQRRNRARRSWAKRGVRGEGGKRKPAKPQRLATNSG